ncbi:NUDIX hydrolase [Corynebacterium flavescens]
MTRLRPDLAPAWLRPALGLDTAKLQQSIGSDRTRVFSGPLPRRRRESAVLLLWMGRSLAEAEVLLTHRSPTMRAHSGQIAFPGGRRDAADATLVDTALREAEEETGLKRATVTPLELWEEVNIRATGNPVSTVQAYWNSPGEVWTASPEETDDVFCLPLAELIDPAHRAQVGFKQWSGPAFFARGYVVWGFTAGVLSTLIAHAGWEEEWDNNSVLDLRETLLASRNNEKMV